MVICPICGSNGTKNYVCDHEEIVKNAKITLSELKKENNSDKKTRTLKVESILNLFNSLSEESKFGISLLIAQIRLKQNILNTGKVKKYMNVGALGGLELVIELVKNGYLARNR